MKHYVSQIRNQVDYHDLSFEEEEERQKRVNERRNEITAADQRLDRLIKEDDILDRKPGGMSNEEWLKKEAPLVQSTALGNSKKMNEV